MKRIIAAFAVLFLLTACSGGEEAFPFYRLVQSPENLRLDLIRTEGARDRDDPDMQLREAYLRELAYLDMGLEDITPEGCQLLLTTPFWLIGEVYGMDMAQQPEGGLLLEGRDIATPVVFLPLSTGTFIAATCQGADIENTYPTSILFWGMDGEAALLPGYGFGMDVGHAIGEIEESFYKLFEAGEERPARTLDIHRDGLRYHLSFLSPAEGVPVEEHFTLDTVRVYLDE